jgi:hypothetical protein
VLSDITANDTSTITLADNVTPLITGGTTAIKVRPHWTLGTVFGPTNSAGLQGSNTPLNADTVSVLNGTTGGFTVYFFSTTNNRWQNGPSDATNSVLRPDSGLLVQRKVTSAVSFTLVGEVKLGPTEIMIAGGNAAGNSTIVPNPYPLASLPLSQIGLYTGNATTGFVGSTTPLNADTLSVLNPATGGFTVYFYNTTNNRWQNGPSDASNVTIPEGAAVLITRKLGRAAFPWYVPQPSMNL